MMMGEFEYNTVFKQNNVTDDDVPFKYIAFPMWALFVVLVPVLMTNLLVRAGYSSFGDRERGGGGGGVR